MEATPKNPKSKPNGAPMRATCSCTAPLMVRGGLVVCASCAAPVVTADGPRVAGYSQKDGERPVGRGRESYLAIWKLAHDAGDPGATADGRARLLTAVAYARHAKVRTAAAPSSGPRLVVRSADDQALADLGLTRRTA